MKEGGGGIVQAVAIVLSISSMSDCPPVTSNLPTDIYIANLIIYIANLNLHDKREAHSLRSLAN